MPLSGATTVSPSGRPVTRERPRDDDPAELGVLQQLPDRILALAGEIARRLRLQRVADRA